MSKYIELIDKYRIVQSEDTDYNPPSYEWIDNTGEIVRCKDCMYGEHCYPSKRIGEEAEPAYWCKFMDQIVSVDGYCAYGKKMDGKGEGE